MQLLVNDNGTLTNQAIEYGVEGLNWGANMISWADLNNDGLLDFFDGIHDTIGRVSTQLLNRQGSDFKEHLHEIEQELSHNLDLVSLDHTLLQMLLTLRRTQLLELENQPSHLK